MENVNFSPKIGNFFLFIFFYQMEIFIRKIKKKFTNYCGAILRWFCCNIQFVVGTSLVNHLFQVCSLRNAAVLVLLGKESFSFKISVLTEA